MTNQPNSRFHCCLILRVSQHPNLQQPPPQLLKKKVNKISNIYILRLVSIEYFYIELYQIILFYHPVFLLWPVVPDLALTSLLTLFPIPYFLSPWASTVLALEMSLTGIKLFCTCFSLCLKCCTSSIFTWLPYFIQTLAHLGFSQSRSLTCCSRSRHTIPPHPLTPYLFFSL